MDAKQRSDIARRAAQALWANSEAAARLAVKRKALWEDPKYRQRQQEARGEKWRREISLSHMGEKNPMYGRKGEANPAHGRKRTEETRAKIRLANLRNRERLSASKKGPKNPMYGKPLRPETKAKLSAIRRGNKWRLGIPQPREAVEQQRAAMKEKWRDPKFRARVSGYWTLERRAAVGRKSRENWQSQDFREKTVSAIFAGSYIRPNKPERELSRILQSHYPGEWKYVGDGKVIIGGKCPDFINVNGKKRLIELFGIYWHSPFDVAKKKEHYRTFGFAVAIVWEDELADEARLLRCLARRFR